MPEIRDQLDVQPEKAQELLAFYRRLEGLGDVFVGQGGYRIKINPRAKTFYFDVRAREINISPRLIERLALEPDEQEFAFLHELGHLSQLLQNPEAYLETFDIPKQKEKDAEGKGHEENVSKFIKEAWGEFFTIMLDIHDNALVIHRRHPFQRNGKASHVPPHLYAEKLFAEDDYRQYPQSYQFMYALIRNVMSPEEAVVIEESVQECISQGVRLFGRQYSSVEEFAAQQLHNPRLRTDEILFRLKQVIMPMFEKLLEDDVRNGRTRAPTRDVDLDGEWSEDVVRDIADQHREAQKPASQRQGDKHSRELKDWAASQDFNETNVRRMEEIRQKTEKVITSLRTLWDNFIQRSVEIGRAKQTGFPTGAGVDPTTVMREMPVVLTNPGRAEIFYRTLPQEAREFFHPRRISLWLAVDLSGSMGEEKRKAVQEVAYALNKSLINFFRDAKVASGSKSGEEPITIDMRVIGFGTGMQELLARSPEEQRLRRKIVSPGKDLLDTQLWDAVFQIHEVNLGGTQDAPALEVAEKAVASQEVERALSQNEEIQIVLEITDGETETAARSKQLVAELNARKGVYCRAIQIPGPLYADTPAPQEQDERGIPKQPEELPATGVFQEVWGDEYGKRLDRLDALRDTMFAILRDALEQYTR